MAAINNTLETLLNEHDVAAILKISVASVRRRRLRHQPPDFLKIGASVRYSRQSIERLILASEQQAEAQ